MKPQFRVKMLNGRCDAAFFIAGGITTESNCNGGRADMGLRLIRSLKLQAIQDGPQRAGRFAQGSARPAPSVANPTAGLLWLHPTLARERHMAADLSHFRLDAFRNARRTTQSTEPATWPKQCHRPHFALAQLVERAIAFASRQAPPRHAGGGNPVPEGRGRRSQYTGVVAVVDKN